MSTSYMYKDGTIAVYTGCPYNDNSVCNTLQGMEMVQEYIYQSITLDG